MAQNRVNIERDYIHMSVGDVLMLCMEDSSVTPIQQLVESLVVIGPDGLTVLQEILDEASKRKMQVSEDQDQVLRGLMNNLAQLGLELPADTTAASMISMRSARFHQLMKKQNISIEKNQIECMQLLQDSRDLLIGLSIKLDLLARIQEYLSDWAWGLYYISSQDPGKRIPPSH